MHEALDTTDFSRVEFQLRPKSSAGEAETETPPDYSRWYLFSSLRCGSRLKLKHHAAKAGGILLFHTVSGAGGSFKSNQQKARDVFSEIVGRTFSK